MCPPCLRYIHRERVRVRGSSKREFDSVQHVGASRPNTTVSPLSLRERARVRGFSKREFGSVSHVGAALANTTASPLSPWERVRVRGSSRKRLTPH
jgi:hypothetical protein